MKNTKIKKNMYELYIDGASRGNPGPSSVGVSLLQEGNEIDSISEAIGTQTNNIAEYTALIRGLALAVEKKVTHIKAYSDSQLLVRQVLGQYKVRDAKIKALYVQVIELMRKFDHFEIEHVYRENNQRADELANQALDNL